MKLGAAVVIAMLTFGVAACRPLGLVVAMNDGGNVLASCYHVVDAGALGRQ